MVMFVPLGAAISNLNPALRPFTAKCLQMWRFEMYHTFLNLQWGVSKYCPYVWIVTKHTFMHN